MTGQESPLWRSPRRLLFAAIGLVCVGLAFLGALLPGLPTTIFLIAASYLFARSFPALADRMLSVPVFRPFLPYVRGDEPMPRRARVAALVAMWIAVSISLTLLYLGGGLPPWLAALMLTAALLGTYSIVTFRR